MNTLSMLCANAVFLINQVRNLKWMGFRIPFSLIRKVNQANLLYPYAVSLMESMRTYELTCEKLVANEQVAPLVSSAKQDCQTAIQEVRTNCLYSVSILYVHMYTCIVYVHMYACMCMSMYNTVVEIVMLCMYCIWSTGYAVGVERI